VLGPRLDAQPVVLLLKVLRVVLVLRARPLLRHEEVHGPDAQQLVLARLILVVPDAGGSAKRDVGLGEPQLLLLEELLHVVPRIEDFVYQLLQGSQLLVARQRLSGTSFEHGTGPGKRGTVYGTCCAGHPLRHVLGLGAQQPA